MNRRLFGALGVVAAFTLTVGSCKSDPFSSVHGTPAAVVTDFSYLQLPIGGSAAVKASIVDATATPLAESAAATRHSSGGVGVSPATSGTRSLSHAATGPRPHVPLASRHSTAR